MKTIQRITVNFWKAIIWALFVLNISIVNINISGSGSFLMHIPNFDKVVHISIYLVLTLFLLDGFFRSNISFAKSVVIASLITLFYGGFIEVIQAVFLPHRTGDIFDMLANSSGIIIAILIYPKLRFVLTPRKNHKKEQPTDS